ncbi:helix-turn-helix domain-containing protein [Serratia odorifera]|jgi:ActR/RegA family two-component response regulator|uniref:BetR domain protein n=2 Tax=Serratia odorifera TaxID=618 RepID=D4DYV8_SEROD|nr:helix-turn-helix domain-containing protein [Serratia odorifera]EFE97280.1 BetR domain protein [Serratia odorifera DSM 4582]MBJ2066588.1 response regulator [Serratia odorifera]PNK91757.1 histidine kinase [Serratia odorifera]RII72907.1 response regulator [Serratia odorifera]VDZ54585.1 BetR domain [Serratia odorifera]
MDNNHQKFDSQSIANRVRALFLHHGIGKRQQAKELSRILALSFSHAHRKLKGQSPWTLEQINSVAAALDETPAAIVDMNVDSDAPAQTIARDAIFSVAGVELPCVAYIGHELNGGRLSDYVALQHDDQWVIYRVDDAPTGNRYCVELIEIRPHSADDERLSIAVLDDSHQAADELTKYLNSRGFHAVAFYDVAAFCQALSKSLFDGYVVDWLIGQETAVPCIEAIRASDNPDAPVLVLTGQLGTGLRESEIAQAMRDYDVLGPYEKPVRLHVIEAALQRCFNL